MLLRVAPVFVEICSAGIAGLSRLCGLGSQFNGAFGGMLGLVGYQRRPQCRELLVGLSRRKPLAASSMAALVQRSAIDASCQRFTLRQTRRMVPIMFSMMLVQASERRRGNSGDAELIGAGVSAMIRLSRTA